MKLSVTVKQMSFKNLDTTWSLDELYTSFDSEKFKSDFEQMKQDFEEMTKSASEIFNGDGSVNEKLEWFINKENHISKYFLLYRYASLTLATDASNEKAMKIMDTMSVLFTELVKPRVLFEKYVASIDNLEEFIEKSSFLQDYSYFLTSIKENSKYLLSESEEVVISKLNPTGSHAWGLLQSQLTATLMVDIELDGKQDKKPLTVIRNMAYDADGELRKKAYEAELKAYEQIDKSVAFALNAIKGEVIATANLRGYESPLHMTLINSRMDINTLDALISSMEDFLPSLRRFYIKKAEMLGHKNGLPFYDLFAPIGNSSDMRFTYEEAADFVVKNFSSFSEKLSNYAKFAFENRWIDALPKEGKRGGAFCAGIHQIKQSRILSNFDGSFSSVATLAHELGHGYHGELLKDEPYINTDYPMPLAETASTFCETIITDAALKSAKDEDKKIILENMISDSLQVIVDIYSRYTFESEVFTNRKDGSMSVAEFKNMMISAQKKAYGNGLDNNYLHPYMWVCKGHYYSAGYNFYNFPYAYGLLFAKGLYSQFLQEGASFVEKYDNLLNETGKNNLVGVAKKAGIDVRSKDFWISSLKLIENDIDTFCNI